MKTKVLYKNGWILEIPKEGHGCMLFLEWLSVFNAAQIPLHSIGTDDASSILQIRLNVNKAVYKNCAKYINDNL